MPAGRISRRDRWAGRRCSRRSATARMWACSSTHRIWCGSSWIRSQAAREFVDKIYDVHLKDTEILWHVVRRGGIQPVNNARWWRFRVPGYGSVDWKGFFSVLAEAGYTGAMNIENEDQFYYPAYEPGQLHRAVQARIPRGARVSEDARAARNRVILWTSLDTRASARERLSASTASLMNRPGSLRRFPAHSST